MRFTIRKRICLSFLLLVSLFVINAIITFITINYNKKLSNHISEVIDPSLAVMEDFEDMMIESKMYTSNWIFLRANQDDKNALLKLHSIDYPVLKSRLNSYSSQWKNKNLADSLNNIQNGFELLLRSEKDIMSSLSKFDDYDDPEKKFGAEEKLESVVLPITSKLIASLSGIVDYEKNLKKTENTSLNDSSVLLRILIVCLALTIIILGIVLSVYMTRKIITPINKIRDIVNDLGKGIIRNVNHKVNGDEIGEMARSVNNLSEKLSAAASFATSVGNRNFDAHFEPLGDKDELGKAIITMRDNLKKSESELQEANYQMRTFFQNIDKVFFSIDMVNQKLLQMSPACEKVYGRTAINFSMNFNLWNEVILEEDKKIIQTMYDCALSGKPAVYEYRIYHKDGSVRWIETNITPTLDKENTLIRIDGVTSDIGERKETEETLR